MCCLAVFNIEYLRLEILVKHTNVRSNSTRQHQIGASQQQNMALTVTDLQNVLLFFVVGDSLQRTFC